MGVPSSDPMPQTPAVTNDFDDEWVAREEYNTLQKWALKRIAELRVFSIGQQTRARLAESNFEKQLQRADEFATLVESTQGQAFSDGMLVGAIGATALAILAFVIGWSLYYTIFL